jgi:crossover junction endodeoxyribonuclease RusA
MAVRRLVLELPFPPSVNRLWRVGKGGRMYRSRPYMRWLKRAGLEWMVQRVNSPIKRIDGPFTAEIILCAPDKRRRDVDNLAKAAMDALVHFGIIVDDSLCRKVTIGWGEAPTGCRVIIEGVGPRKEEQS